MHRVDVLLDEHGYPIHIGPGAMSNQQLFEPHLSGSQVAVISNETVAPLYLDELLKALGETEVDVFTLPDGERHKTLESYSAIMDFLMAKRHNRSTTLVALGGGVVGDITGFVAATFQRGVGLIQVPTTLLAQVDSAVGGKTAVNHPGGKNMIGAFHQPRCVIADSAVFATLPDREYRAGLAEVLKYGVIADAEFFAWMEAAGDGLLNKNPDTLAWAVRRSCEIKAGVVAQDERETGLRAILNFGHTFGHAIETLTNYRRFLHGEAVAIGMVMAADLSARQGCLPLEDAQRIKTVLQSFELPVCPPAELSDDVLHRAMGMDKKVVDGRLRLVLVEAIGQVAVSEEIDASALNATLNAADALCDG
ncbi:MAG: 3-dehydroquinate synthase [Gammaproteobacteria bacterium]|nr:3-dehydroquinate synthase [Gammaproteobacteria bacterium]